MRDKLKRIWLTDPEDIKKAKIRNLFQLYLIVIGLAEVVVLVLFWLIQIEEAGPEMTGTENIPFHKKAYFLTSFLIPVIVTFILGFVSELRKKYDQSEETKAARIRTMIRLYGFAGIRKVLLWLLPASGLGLFLFFLGSSISGSENVLMNLAPSFLVYALVFFAGACLLAGITVMLLRYRAKIRAIKTEYRKAVSRHLGRARVD